MLQKASTVTLDLTSGIITPSTPIYARDALQITLTNIDTLVAANAKAALYRGNLDGIDGTLVATCSTFTLSGGNLVGSMSLNTVELVAAFTAKESIRQGEKAIFTILVYDADADVYIIFDQIHVSYEFPLAAGTPPNVSPITTSTAVWGSLRLYNGDLYRYNSEDGLYYRWLLAGTGDGSHELLDSVGISL